MTPFRPKSPRTLYTHPASSGSAYLGLALVGLLEEVEQQVERRVEVVPELVRVELEGGKRVPQRRRSGESHSHVFVGSEEGYDALVESGSQLGRQFYAGPAAD